MINIINEALFHLDVPDVIVDTAVELFLKRLVKLHFRHIQYTFVSVYFSSAWDRRTGTQVAIKKLHRPFQSKLFAKRAYRELRLLKHMKHENVRKLSTAFYSLLKLNF